MLGTARVLGLTCGWRALGGPVAYPRAWGGHSAPRFHPVPVVG